ncbi:uncharacterized protein BT62DRAFT_797834 [Guyanagaster necrorhizus]|uniref:F-box domain-containing protein n=1 Tax=Guyanagaster necrorhizus TaxID=856835 RepID=A0A9P7VFD9_9AGAR|nr:uncharacterized protein BT62DRAFT_797834 [Guyanagaster necrorhizus MCA 3950]KAG7439151.1 hypothetical protein BT62DRAFT_797834 [Guyanagaster necrorhizus MCA 3950]
MNLTLLDDNVLIHTITFLSVPHILALRQTCRRFDELTREEHIWINILNHDILPNEYPFPLEIFDTTTDLEHHVRNSYRLAGQWRSQIPQSPMIKTFYTERPVSEVKLLPGRGHKWLLAVSEGKSLVIWNILLWSKCSIWTPLLNDGGFTDVKVNDNPESEAAIAVSLSQRIALLCLHDDGHLFEVFSLDVNLFLVTLAGDFLALTNRTSETIIRNWKTGELAHLDTPSDHCLETIITPPTILVVCTRSISRYVLPSRMPVDQYSFEPIDGASATPTSILIRGDMSSADINCKCFQYYSISSFPPTLIAKTHSPKRTIGCPKVVLGKRATAVWIHSDQSHWFSGWSERSDEAIIAAVFPGPLNDTGYPCVYNLCINTRDPWISLDYDEDVGRIAVASRTGQITICQL